MPLEPGAGTWEEKTKEEEDKLKEQRKVARERYVAGTTRRTEAAQAAQRGYDPRFDDPDYGKDDDDDKDDRPVAEAAELSTQLDQLRNQSVESAQQQQRVRQEQQRRLQLEQWSPYASGASGYGPGQAERLAQPYTPPDQGGDDSDDSDGRNFAQKQVDRLRAWAQSTGPSAYEGDIYDVRSSGYTPIQDRMAAAADRWAEPRREGYDPDEPTLQDAWQAYITPFQEGYEEPEETVIESAQRLGPAIQAEVQAQWEPYRQYANASSHPLAYPIGLAGEALGFGAQMAGDAARGAAESYLDQFRQGGYEPQTPLEDMARAGQWIEEQGIGPSGSDAPIYGIPGERYFDEYIRPEVVEGEDYNPFTDSYVPDYYGQRFEERNADSEGVMDAARNLPGNLLDLVSIGSSAVEAGVVTGRDEGYTWGELVSAVGEAAQNIPREAFTDPSMSMWDYLQQGARENLRAKYEARGGKPWSEMTDREREIAKVATFNGYSGTEANVATRDAYANQAQNVDELRQEAWRLLAAGRMEEASAVGAAAYELSQKTANDFIDDNMKLLPTIIAQSMFDPLLAVDAAASVFKAGPAAVRASRAYDNFLRIGDDAVTKTIDELTDALMAGAKSGEGRSVASAINPFALTNQSKAAIDRDNAWAAISSMTGNIETRESALDFVKALIDNPKNLVDAAKRNDISLRGLGDEDAGEAIKRLLPAVKDGMENITTAFKSLNGEGKFNPLVFNMELFENLDAAANTHYGIEAGKVGGFTDVSDFLRSFMSDQFLNTSPRHLVRNGVSAIGHLAWDDQMTFRKIDDVADFFLTKFGDMPSVRSAEAYGSLAAQGAGTGPAGYYGSGGGLQRLAKRVPGFNKVLFASDGTPRWASNEFFGEQNFYARAMYAQFRKHFDSNWTSYAERALPQALANAGLDETLARNLTSTIIEQGISGNRKDILDTATSIVNGNAPLYSLREIVTQDALDRENYRALREVFDGYARGALDEGDASQQIRDIFSVERKKFAAIADDAGGDISQRSVFSEMADSRDAARAADNLTSTAKVSGVTDADASDLMLRLNEENAYVREAIGNALNEVDAQLPASRQVVTDTWRRIQELRDNARMAQGRAFETWSRSARTDINWNQYNQAVRDAYDVMWQRQRTLLDDLPIAMNDAANGQYRPHYQNHVDIMERATDVSLEELEEVFDSGTKAERIQAQRQAADIYAADMFDALRMSDDMATSADIVFSAENDVHRMGIISANRMDDLRQQLRSKEITQQQFDTMSDEVWDTWRNDVANRYGVASRDIREQRAASAAASVDDAQRTPLPPPSDDEIRALASESGIASRAESGADTTNWVINVINKDLGLDIQSLDELSDADRMRVREVLNARARRASGVDDVSDDMYDLYRRATDKRQAAGDGLAPTVSDMALSQYDNLESLQRQALAALQNVNPLQGSPVDRATARNVVAEIRKILPGYQDILDASRRAAIEGADTSMLNYNKRRNFDTMISAVVPYHYWYTRSIPNWITRAASRPGMAATYLRTGGAADRYQEQDETPERYSGMIPVPFTDNEYWMRNPADLLFPGDLLMRNGFADPDDANGAAAKSLEYGKFWGFGTFPVVDAAIKVADGRGDEIDWGNVMYPMSLVNDTFKTATGRDIAGFLRGPYDPYTEGRSVVDMAVASGADPNTALYAQQIIANLEQGKPQYYGIPADAQDEANALYQSGVLQQASDALLRSGSSWLTGLNVARYSPEERQMREASSQYRTAGYEPTNPFGSQAAADFVMDQNPMLSAWWEKTNLIPDNIDEATPGARAQTSQYWDAHSRIMDTMNAEVETFLQANPGATRSELSEIKQPFFDLVKDLGDKYTLSTPAQTRAYWTEYDAIADARLQTVIDMKDATPEERREAMRPFNEQLEELDATYPFASEQRKSTLGRRNDNRNPYELAEDIIYDVADYEPPGKPERPGDGATEEAWEAYYDARSEWESKRLDYVERVMNQTVAEERGPAEQVAAQAVLGRYASEIIMAEALQYAGAWEIAWTAQDDLQGQYDRQFYDTLDARIAQQKAERWARLDAQIPGIQAIVESKPVRRKSDDPELYNQWKESLPEGDYDKYIQYVRQLDDEPPFQRFERPMAPVALETPAGEYPVNADREPIGLSSDPTITLDDGTVIDRPSPQIREQYEQEIQQINPFMGFDGQMRLDAPPVLPPGETLSATDRAMLEAAGQPVPVEYNPRPGLNAPPITTPDELVALQEALDSGIISEEDFINIQQSIYARSGDGGSAGGGGGGGGGGGWGRRRGGGGGGRSYTGFAQGGRGQQGISPYDVRYNRLRFLEQWRPYLDTSQLGYLTRNLDRSG